MMTKNAIFNLSIKTAFSMEDQYSMPDYTSSNARYAGIYEAGKYVRGMTKSSIRFR